MIVGFTVTDGKRQEYLDSMRSFFTETLAKAGCLECEPAIDVSAPFEEALPADGNVVTFVEKWECMEALRAHVGSEHVQQALADCGHLIRRIDIQVLELT